MKPFGALVLLVLILEGCATGNPVTSETPRDYLGFSIVPPQGAGWQVKTLRGDAVLFSRKSETRNHTLFLGVERRPVSRTFANAEAYLKYVSDAFFSKDSMYYEILAKEVYLNDKYGQFCVKYYYEYKDVAARPSNVPYLIREGRCYACLHPDARYYEFRVCRWEEYAPGEEDPQLRTEEEAFIENFTYSKLDR